MENSWRRLLAFYWKLKDSSLCLQDPAIAPYDEPTESSTRIYVCLLSDTSVFLSIVL